jgi:molybdopterin molybdotransferase
MNATLPLLPVADALSLTLTGAAPKHSPELVDLALCRGRTLAADLPSKRTQPPFPSSAMDGYALRAEDIAETPASLDVIGTSVAGRRFGGEVGPGQAVRIFTGAPVPPGADTVLIQEDATRDGDRVTALETEARGRNIRPLGLDFETGEILLSKGRRLAPSDLALAAAMNHVSLPVFRAPRVAVLATGDELVRPGAEIGPDQIVSSNNFAVSAYAAQAGAECLDLGIAGDSIEALDAALGEAVRAEADVLVTLGGASVGDHDLVQSALARKGMTPDFWRIAMRPGKPLMYGQLGDLRVLGLPGNPVSAIVCSILFLVPLVRALCGDPHAGRDPGEPAILGADLRANDSRQDYLRARLSRPEGGPLVATPFSAQDSSMLKTLAWSEALVIRPPHAPPARAGERCLVIRL